MASLSIGQLERIFALPASTLRFWDRTVPFLTPARTQSGRRSYSLSEAVLISRLKHLALDKGLGLSQAKKLLEFELLDQNQEIQAEARGLREMIVAYLWSPVGGEDLLRLIAYKWQVIKRSLSRNESFYFVEELCNESHNETHRGFH